MAVLHLREQYPRWGKDKLVVMIRDRGWQVSTSMVGRILSSLKARGVLREPLRSTISTRKRLWRRPYAVRKPKGYGVKEPGDLVQVDTLDVRPLPGMVLKHFTARDVVSRWDVVEAHTRATANTSATFLNAVLDRMPFPVHAIRVDGGSEFQAGFEEACREQGIRLFVLPPRSPKLNGCVERAQRTHTEEFYEVNDFSLEIAPLNRELLAWERIYNTVRPHQAPGYLTPHHFVTRSLSHKKEVMCHPSTGRVQDLDFSRTDWLTLVCSVLLMVAACMAFALFLGNLVLKLRHWVTVFTIANGLVVVLSGVLIPTSDFPAALQGVAHLLPLTHGLLAFRDAFDGAGVTSVGWDLIGELLVAVGYGIAGPILFRLFEADAKRKGTYETVT